MCEALVEYDYTAQEQDELTIKKGDIIKDVAKKHVGWCEGVLNDKRGVFPENFVKFIDKEVTYRNKKDSVRQCRVIFSYQPVHPDEILLNIGDIVNIIGEDEEGWWRGIQNGREGVFPSNFVEEIFPSKPKTKSSSGEDLPNLVGDGDSRIPNLPPKPAKILCEVKYAYKAQNDDELSLKEGDIITLTNRELPDPGWWEGELNGKIGVFPDNFVNVIKQSDDKLHKDDAKYTKVTSDSIPLKSPVAAVSQRTSLEPKNDIDSKANPPLLHKKPLLPKKKSPSSATKAFLSGIVNRKSDSVDGSMSSKPPQVKLDLNVLKDNPGENAFDQVERNPLLKDVRAGRAKPPVRRPPTSSVKDKSPAFDSEEGVTSEEEAPENKAPVREWEKHKAPWLEEMKMNQAKRSSTSPISEKNLNTKGLYPEIDKSLVDNIMSKSMPCPVTSKISPNEPVVDSKAPPPTSVLKAKPNNLQNLPRNNYSNVEIPLSFNNVTNPVSPNATNAAKPSVQVNPSKPINTNSNEKCNNTEKLESSNRNSGEYAQNETMTLTVQQYSDLLDRIQRLEIVVDKQAATIEDLKARLFIHWDKRKIEMQNVTQ